MLAQWPRFINVALGMWLMATPAVLGIDGTAASNSQIVGPLIVSFSLMAYSEVLRMFRWVSLTLGVWSILGAFVFDYPTAGMINAVAVGLAVIGFALIRGPINEHFDGRWSALWPPCGTEEERAEAQQGLPIKGSA